MTLSSSAQMRTENAPQRRPQPGTQKNGASMTKAGDQKNGARIPHGRDAFEIASLELLFEALNNGHPQIIIAHGNSMGAHLPSGAQVWLVPTCTMRLGQVVAVADLEGQFLVHRVVGLRTDGSFLLKGDANPKPDGWFPPETPYAGVYAYRTGDAWKPPGYGPLPSFSFWHRAKRRLLERIKLATQRT
jgi:hypothetical protein